MLRKVIQGVLLCFLSFSLPASAEDTVPVSLTLPEHFASEACPQKVWKDLRLSWKGIEDARPRPELGEINPGSDHPSPAISPLPLTQVFENALKPLFARCGVVWAPAADESVPQLSVRIETFYMGVDKKLFTQKGKAASSLDILVEKPGVKTSARVGFEIETKSSRFQSKEKLQKTLNELFARTLEQLPKNSTLREMK